MAHFKVIGGETNRLIEGTASGVRVQLRNVWVVRGTVEAPANSLSTTVTVSGVTTRIDGSEVRVVIPDPFLDYAAAEARGIGEARLVTSNLAFQTGKPHPFSFRECYFIDRDGHETHYAFVSDTVNLTESVSAATGVGVERVVTESEPRSLINADLLSLVADRPLAFAMTYYQEGLNKGESGEALVEFYKAFEAIKKRGVGRLGFTKKEWELVARLAQPFRHSPALGSIVLPLVSANDVRKARDRTREIIEAYARLLQKGP